MATTSEIVTEQAPVRKTNELEKFINRILAAAILIFLLVAGNAVYTSHFYYKIHQSPQVDHFPGISEICPQIQGMTYGEARNTGVPREYINECHLRELEALGKLKR